VVHDNALPVPQIDNATFLVCEDNGVSGTKARNYALDNLDLQDEDLVLFHDDDNIIHPEWYSTISKFINEDFSIITWGQLNKNNTIRLNPTPHPRVNHIDTACFLIKWKYNKDVRHQYFYHHDGLYSEECSKNGSVLCLDQYLCYYNYLR
jgi:hypothetical protein